MLSTKIDTSSITMYVNSDRRRVVSDRHEPLSDYVRRIISEKKLNYREVARRSGGEISHSTVGDIINNPTKDVQIETLRALAKGLGEPESEVVSHARGEKLDDDDFRQSILHMLHEKAKTASREDKRFIERTIKNLLNDLEEGGAGKKAGSA